jgi:hypothetical protein
MGKMDDGPDFDFGLGGLGDMDSLMESMGGSFGSGGGKGKGKKKGEKGDKGPRENDPKQLFVAGVGEASEDDLRDFFEQKGQVTRLKILKDDTGASKGVCFVTYATEEEAQDALSLSGSMLPGSSNTRGISVRPAGQNKDKGDKGGGKGDKGPRDRDRPPRRDFDRDMDGETPFGGGFERNERFGGLGDDRDSRPKGGGKGKGGGQRRNERSEVDEEIAEELAEQDCGPLRIGDFDFASKRFLGELRKIDRNDGTEKFKEALRHVISSTHAKDRDAVRKWTAYVYKLLTQFDPDLAESMRAKDAERRGGAGAGGGFRREER